MPYKDKKYYRDNDKLKRAGIEIPYTQKQINTYKKCSKDYKYFIDTYASIVALPSELSEGGIVPFKLWTFQRNLLDTIHDHRFTIIKLPRQVGKCCINVTPIKIRNKKTGEVINTNIGNFYNKNKANQ